MMFPSARSAIARACILGGVAFALLIAALLPAHVVPIGPDEFGYVKSAVETAQRGRPWTNDYLEPWAAAQSTMSALIFRATGSMRVALHGVIAVCAGLSFAGLAALLRERTGSTRAALLGAALLLSCPVLLRRLSEYIDLVLFLPCLLWCVWAAARQRWVLFAVAWGIAVANRQSAAVWLLLPAAEIARAAWCRSPGWRGGLRAPLFVVLGGGLWFLLLAATMNITDIQLDRTVRPLANFEWRPALQAGATAGFILLLGLGLGAALARDASRPNEPWSVRSRIAIAAITLGALVVDVRTLIRSDAAYGFLYGSAGAVYARCIVALAACGWLAGKFRLRWEVLACGLAMSALVMTRLMVFDRYAIEIGIWALLAVRGESAPAPARQAANFPRWAPAAFCAALACFHAGFALLTKISIDETRALTVLHERALRTGAIRPSELGEAPFPLRGWHLHAHAIAHPMGGGRKLGAYARYVEPNITVTREEAPLLTRLQRRPPAREPRGPVIAEDEFRVGWFWRTRYQLRRLAPPQEPGPLGRDYQPQRLPLSDAEWRALVHGPALR